MANDRLYRETVRWDLAYPEAFANPYLPTPAEMNNAALVKNITCALDEDGTEFTLGDSDSDDSLTFCDAAGSSSPTFKNPSATLVAVRDKDRIASGVFNEAFNHLAYKDVPYILILRLGKRSDAAYAANDIVKMAGFLTDNPVDVLASGDNAKLQQTLLNNDFVNWNYKLV